MVSISVRAGSSIITVPDDYSTIQAAINEANLGDTIFVRNGTYYENVVINNTVLLTGEDPSKTIIYGSQGGGWVIRMDANNVTVTGFSIESSVPTRNTGVGIYADNCNVSGNVIMNNNDGIELIGDFNTLSQNRIMDNERYGIYVRTSSNNGISQNAVTEGILLSNSSLNNITENNCDSITIVTSSNNNSLTGNILVGSGLYLYSSYGTVADHNLVNGKPLVYFEGSSRQLIEDAGEVILLSCENMRITNVTSSGASIGIELLGTNDTEITANDGVLIQLLAASDNNTITGNERSAVQLDSSSNNLIACNTMANNSDGIELYASSNNIVDGNEIMANGNDGIRLMWSSSNTINQNEVIGNKPCGIELSYSSNDNRILGNNISRNDVGIYLSYSSNANSVSANDITENNVSGATVGYRVPESDPEWGGCLDNNIYGNNITGNGCGIQLIYSSNTSIFHNNFDGNNVQTYVDHSQGSLWDNGHPSGGNYWSDYNGSDLYSGPYQNETGSDWIGDSPYVIDQSNSDRYPLMRPFVPEMEETRLAYRNVLLENDELHFDLDALNSTYNELMGGYSQLVSNFEGLNFTYVQLLDDLDGLLTNFTVVNMSYQQLLLAFSRLQGNYTSLQGSYNELQTSFNALTSSYNSQNATFNDYKASTQNDLSFLTDLVYAFIAITAILVGITAYLATRKSKTMRKPETATESETQPQT